MLIAMFLRVYKILHDFITKPTEKSLYKSGMCIIQFNDDLWIKHIGK